MMWLARGLRLFSSSRLVQVDFSHAVIGGGIVGMAVAAELLKNQGNSVLLVEKHPELGQETTSRNSEVIHAGLYYPPDSLKFKLCLEGKQLIYSEAQSAGVEMQNCGKWIVAQTEEEQHYLEQVHARVSGLGIPIEFLPLQKGTLLEPHIHVGKAILNSPTTGIISAHSLLSYLESVFQDNDGEVALGAEVVGIDYNEPSQEYTISVDSEGSQTLITLNNVINSAGLYACQVSNLLLPVDRHLTQYYAKGNYFSFTKSSPKVQRLIYPCPTKNIQSLGTHLTIDLGGQIKFGPDLEWIESPDDYSVNGDRRQLVYNDVKRYFPSIELQDLSPSYSGIRPKLIDKTDKKFQDFVIREEPGYKGFVNLLGIESPGLTSSMAIAKYVSRLL